MSASSTGDIAADEQLEAPPSAAQAQPAAAAAAGGGGTSETVPPGHVLKLRPVPTLPPLPALVDDEVRALYSEMQAEDGSAAALQQEVAALLSLPPAGLAKKTRDSLNMLYRLQAEEVEVLVELGISPSSSFPR